MSCYRRVTALLLVLLLAQLTLVGSGYTCITGVTDAGMGAMPGMQGMAGMPDMNAPLSDATQPAESPEGPSPDDCTLPWAPSGCTLMVPCAPHALSANIATTLAGLPPGHTAPALDIGVPASPIITPDPPPPKA